MGLFPAAVRHLFYYYRARGNFHLPLPFQGMKVNEEISHMPQRSMARPAEFGITRGLGFVGACYFGEMRGRVETLGIFFAFFGDGLHGFNKTVERLFRFRFGRFDHQSPINN